MKIFSNFIYYPVSWFDFLAAVCVPVFTIEPCVFYVTDFVILYLGKETVQRMADYDL